MQIKESDLLFRFDKKWLLRKYDEHPFYSRLSGAGYKAVDIVSIYNNNQLVLWEIKNFNHRKPNLRHDPLLEVSTETQAFIKRMASKAIDTLAALSVIDQYYQRRLFYNLRQRFMRNSYFQSTNWYFWLKSFRLSDMERLPIFILWVEGYQLEEQYLNQLRAELKGVVSDVYILDMSDYYIFEGMEVHSTINF